MNHAISINSDKTLVITLPEGTQVDRVMIRKMGTQESKLYWRDEVLDQYKWERDIAIQQLKDLGYGFGEKPKADGDTISRQEAIDIVRDIDTKREVYDALDELRRLPSAEQEPPTEIQDILTYLDEKLHPIVSPENWNVYSELHDMISKLFTKPERKKGKWIDGNHRQTCSVCLYRGMRSWSFCPSCGADMRGEEDE